MAHTVSGSQQTLRYVFLCLLFVFLFHGIFFDIPDLYGGDLPNPIEHNSVWKLNKEEDGICVYSFSGPDYDSLVFKADMIINTSLDSILALMVDIDNYIRWIAGCKKSRQLMKVSDTEYIGHVLIKAGLIFSDRDFVLRAKAFQDPESKVARVIYTSLDGYLPKSKDTVRIIVNEGFWILIPLSENKVRLIWQGKLHPGGWFPTWLLRMLFDTVVLKTMREIRVEVKGEKYQNIILFDPFK